ncbi:MAG: cell division protein SepF [Oscillospiraceae bacterium]|nr:cell division protein SepF [Oscillospiraceae bacterium]MBQ6757118.1 cell division protein SepF [Oscillospiraceae bacterium]MBR0063342.1 cell division protein SepF [Oscillospiraceae bacterium]
MKFLDELKKITRPYDEEDEEFEDFSPRTPERVPVTPRTAAPQRTFVSDNFNQEKRDNKVVNIHATTQLQVVLVAPERFETAAEIADHLREKRTVVLNLEKTSKEISRRLLDFLSGVAYAQDGKIKKVAVNTYLITPYNVDLMGDLLDELENNGLYF